MKRVRAFSTLITQGLLGRLQKLLHVTTAFEYGMSTKRIPVRFRVFFSLLLPFSCRFLATYSARRELRRWF